MKVKNLWVGIIRKNKVEKIVIVREASFVKKVIKLSLEDRDQEYKCIFTNKKCWINNADIVPFAFFMEIDQLKKRMSRKEVREFYKEKKEDMINTLTNKSKFPMGFSGEQSNCQTR